MTHLSHRHRGSAHRRHRRLSSRRALAAGAIGAVLLTAGAVGVQAIVGAASDEAVATTGSQSSIGEPPVSTGSSGAGGASRDAERSPLSTTDLSAIDEAAAAAAEQIEESAEKAKKDAAKAAKIRDAQKNPRAVAETMLGDYGWDAAQFSCLDRLWGGESDWDYTATNPSSGAYGIPQSLPANKMATASDDWETNPITQIRWGLDYIRASYGTPCSAQGFKSGHGWY